MRFDWAMKRLLRDKANFGVLEGLITTLLNMPIHIKSLLESESNQETEYQKQNRVDLLAEDDEGRLYLIEVQNENEFAYFYRMLFGTSKLVTEYIERGQGYENIRKIYSINIVYFPLGSGSDYVYHGKTEFRGIHTGELLEMSYFQRSKLNVSAVSDLYPEYFILKANDFNKWSKTPLDQWLYFLSNSKIPEDADAPGLQEARQKMQVLSMSKSEQDRYYSQLDALNTTWGQFEMSYGEGLLRGLEQGVQQGIQQGREQTAREIARELKKSGLDYEQISAMTHLSVAEIAEL